MLLVIVRFIVVVMDIPHLIIILSGNVVAAVLFIHLQRNALPGYTGSLVAKYITEFQLVVVIFPPGCRIQGIEVCLGIPNIAVGLAV